MLLIFAIPFAVFQSYCQSIDEPIEKQVTKQRTIEYLKKKFNLSLAVKGDFLYSIGNIGVFFWNLGMRYEKDDDGNDVLDENGNAILLYPENRLEYFANSFGGEIKIDYLISDILSFSVGFNATKFPTSFFGKKISNAGYFCEAQIKPKKDANVYLFGQFGRTTSTFPENISIQHFQYASGLGIGNDYWGLDAGVHFFGTPMEQKLDFLENYTVSISEQSYLESTSVVLRLTAKLF